MKYDISGLSVCIGMPTTRDLAPQVVKSLLETQEALLERGIPYEMQIVAGSSIISSARTKVGNIFLESNKNRLFWIDSDIIWTTDDFFKILALSTVMECVGATYPAKMLPTRYFLSLDGDELETNEHGCFEMGGFGLGFTCIQRKVMEQIADASERLIFSDSTDPLPAMFRIDAAKPSRPHPKFPECRAARGEDMALFADIQALGYKVNLFPHINLGHIGPHVFRADFMASLKEIDDASRREAAGAEVGQVPGETQVRVLPEGQRLAAAPEHHQPAA